MMRERLVKLIKHDNCISPATCSSKCKYVDSDDCHAERLADYLLANGVIVPPCKVGDIVYLIGLDGTINEYSAVGFCQYPNGVFIDVRYDEKTYSIPIENVYFFREDAERALKGDEGK